MKGKNVAQFRGYVDCDRFGSCDELGGMEAVFPKMEGSIVFLRSS